MEYIAGALFTALTVYTLRSTYTWGKKTRMNLHVIIVDAYCVVRRLQKDKRWAKMGDYPTDFDPYEISPGEPFVTHVPNYAIDFYLVYATDPAIIHPSCSHENYRNAKMKAK